MNCSEHNNGGQTCADVYALYEWIKGINDLRQEKLYIIMQMQVMLIRRGVHEQDYAFSQSIQHTIYKTVFGKC